jgi:phytoene dehydrogenase-like protein
MTAMPRFPVAARVGIVGGGASGLAAAHALRELGCAALTVFEREPRVGGKCSTIMHDGHTYELGAALLTPVYRNVRALMREADVRSTLQTEAPLAGVRDGPSHRLAEELRPLRWPRVAAGCARFALELRRHRRLFEPGFEGLGDELAVPFADWCRTTGCEAIEAAIEPWVTGFGYGFLRDLPALYVLKYTTLFVAPISEILDDGYGGLFQKIVARLGAADVRLAAPVTSVVRRPDAVTVRTTEGEFDFDVLILACPPDEALAFLDATPAEIALFERARYVDYFVLGACVDGPLRRDRYMFLRANLAPSATGRPMFLYRRWPTSNVVFVYGFAPGPDWERDVPREVAACLQQLGGRMGEVIALRRWRYFPHVQTDDIAGGYYRKLEALQGQNRTLYCGEILAFGAVETVVEYARALVHRHFARAP